MKNPLTLAGIEAATFQFVAQHLNHCATAVPRGLYMQNKIPNISEESITHHIKEVSTCALYIDVTKFCVFPTECFLRFFRRNNCDFSKLKQDRQSTYNEKLRGIPVHILTAENQYALHYIF